MVPKRRTAERRDENEARRIAAVVLPFPVRAKEAEERSASAKELPATGERPTLLPPAVREWLHAALIVSLAVHAIVFIVLQLRFHDDLERASGAAEALSSQGTITIPVDVVVEALLPSAPAPTDASASEAKEPQPIEQANIDKLMPPPPEPAPVVMPATDVAKLIPTIEPAPVVLPTRQAARLALPTEETAPLRAAESAEMPQAPTGSIVQARSPAPERAKPVERQEKKSARSTPSAAASPSQAAAANLAGNAGAGGRADTGGSAAVSSYQALVLAHLSRHRVYPPEARERGITGIARVQFALARDGRVLSASLVGGSGERMLDSAAVEMVKRASPFPPFPTGIAQARMDFAAPIRFDLR
jgi:protein TonB